MRPAAESATDGLTQPILLGRAKELHEYLRTVSTAEIQSVMKVSEQLAEVTRELISQWSYAPQRLRPAIDSFLGDIYSGLQVTSLDAEDRAYAQSRLRILSGLYGILRPLDGIYPYRFEMGYRVPDPRFANLYSYWGTAIVDTLPENEMIIDLSAVEYGKTVTKYAKLSPKSMHVVTPRFLTVSPKTGEPTFVVVHAKIARGAFAHWMIRNRIEDEARLKDFDEIGYRYDAASSTPEVPVFICREFQGLGLSVRLT